MLFVDQKKTEAEIVQLLYERNIFVSYGPLSRRCPTTNKSRCHQIRLMLQEWELISFSSSTTSSPSARPASNPRRREATATTGPESRTAYEQRPLPSLPESSKASSSRRARESSKTPHQRHSTQLEGAGRRHHRHGKVETVPRSTHVHQRSSPLEDYVMNAQTYEMIAIGLVKPRRKDRAYL